MTTIKVYRGSSQGLICEYISQLCNYDLYKKVFEHDIHKFIDDDGNIIIDKENGNEINSYSYTTNNLFHRMIQFSTYDIIGYKDKTLFAIVDDNYNEKTVEKYGFIGMRFIPSKMHKCKINQHDTGFMVRIIGFISRLTNIILLIKYYLSQKDDDKIERRFNYREFVVDFLTCVQYLLTFNLFENYIKENHINFSINNKLIHAFNIVCNNITIDTESVDKYMNNETVDRKNFEYYKNMVKNLISYFPLTKYVLPVFELEFTNNDENSIKISSYGLDNIRYNDFHNLIYTKSRELGLTLEFNIPENLTTFIKILKCIQFFNVLLIEHLMLGDNIGNYMEINFDYDYLNIFPNNFDANVNVSRHIWFSLSTDDNNYINTLISNYKKDNPFNTFPKFINGIKWCIPSDKYGSCISTLIDLKNNSNNKKLRNNLYSMLQPFYSNYVYSLITNGKTDKENILYLNKVHKILTKFHNIDIRAIKRRIRNNVPREYQNNSYELVCMTAITKATKFFKYNDYTQAYNDFIHMSGISSIPINEKNITKFYNYNTPFNINNAVKVNENQNIDEILHNIKHDSSWKYIIIAISPCTIVKGRIMRNIYLITHTEFNAMYNKGIEYAKIIY